MSPPRPDWPSLNAYVDGELPPAAAAEVAGALAKDRGLAESAATLAGLKATVHECAEDPGIAILAGPARRRPRRALAACLVGALALGVAALAIPFRGAEAPPPWLATAWAAHETWAVAPAAQGAAAEPSAGQVLTTVSRLGPRAYLPDLTASKLTLSRIAPAYLAGPDTEAMHLGYSGTRGCRVSLFIIVGGAGLPRTFTGFGDGTRQSYAWRSATHGYLLMADGMDQARLKLIADSLRKASRIHQPLDAQTRTALRASRKSSAPCPS